VVCLAAVGHTQTGHCCCCVQHLDARMRVLLLLLMHTCLYSASGLIRLQACQAHSCWLQHTWWRAAAAGLVWRQRAAGKHRILMCALLSCHTMESRDRLPVIFQLSVEQVTLKAECKWRLMAWVVERSLSSTHAACVVAFACCVTAVSNWCCQCCQCC
jgi:hypothetical protein